MNIPKPNIKKVYQYLMHGNIRGTNDDAVEGVIVVKKDTRQPKHEEIDIPNLEVMNLLKSMKSRGLVSEQFSWHHHYYHLTDEGILFLRQYLHLAETVVPLTISKATRQSGRREGGEEQRGERKPRAEGEYRKGGWRGQQQQTQVAA